MNRWNYACLVCSALLATTSATSASAQSDYRASLRVASNGPVTITTLVNKSTGFPGDYFGSVMFRGATSATNPGGLYSYTLFGAGNQPGHANTLSGVPMPDGSYSAFMPKHLPIVINLAMSRPQPSRPWVSVSTADPTRLSSEWVRQPDFSFNRQVAAVRQVARDTIEIGFSYVGQKVRKFSDHALRIRVSNMSMCRG